MRSKIVAVKNVARLSAASRALLARAPGAPGIGLIDGAAGYGKSLATTWLSNQVPSIYVRAIALWTPSTMLGAMCRELRVPTGGSCAQMVERIIESLSRAPRTVFVDEIEYIARNTRLIETLRDLHDLSLVPVVIIGETGIEQKLSHLRRFTSRIAQHVSFQPLDIDDAALLAKELCEVEVKRDLLTRIHAETHGNTRNIVVALGRIEQFAKGRGGFPGGIGAAEWGKKPLFTGQASSDQAASSVAQAA